MPGGNVGDFMRHDCGQLGFIIGREDQAAVHIEETAREGECVDLIRLDDLDRERNLRIRVSNEVLADALVWSLLSFWANSGTGIATTNARKSIRPVRATL